MLLVINDPEIVALISAVLGIVLTLLKFFLEKKKDNSEPNAWKKFKQTTTILLVGFCLGVATCFYLFVSSDWKVKKAFKRFFKKQKQSFHQPR
ncbi:hypothetical protein [Candidatus Uabimicrobium sp. HlEnr_7]|uniref:hypothetical protein n=1 Tax=Candidatus Uabimicrobium helgolandensis TaxID=3095367 RepID=UPI003555E328